MACGLPFLTSFQLATLNAWNISAPHELHNYFCAASSNCDEKCLNLLIHYEGGNETFTNSFKSPNSKCLLQRHLDKGKQDPALVFIQTLDCAYNVGSNLTFQPNQIVIQNTNQENLLVPTYQENISDRCDKSVDRLSKVRRTGREKFPCANLNQRANLLPSDPHRIGDAGQSSIVRFIKYSN